MLCLQSSSSLSFTPTYLFRYFWAVVGPSTLLLKILLGRMSPSIPMTLRIPPRIGEDPHSIPSALVSLTLSHFPALSPFFCVPHNPSLNPRVSLLAALLILIPYPLTPRSHGYAAVRAQRGCSSIHHKASRTTNHDHRRGQLPFSLIYAQPVRRMLVS